jgi:biopolymer transport protein ExbB
MRISKNGNLRRFVCLICLVLSFGWGAAANAGTWWDKHWTVRKQITIDTSAAGVPISDPIGKATVLVRLHDGNYQFLAAKEDGADIRFVASDDKTLLPYHVERYDSLMNEAFVWVQVPDVKPSGQTIFWLYYGNTAAARADDPKGTFDAETVLAYHFSENNAAPADSSAGGNKAENAGTSVAGSLIGGGLRFAGPNVVKVPPAPSIQWTEGSPLTWSAWIKPVSFREKGVLFSRIEGDKSFVIGESNGVPYVEVNGQRSGAGQPLVVNTWRHLAVVADGQKITLCLDGDNYSVLNVALPALIGPSVLGGDGAGGEGFSGEVDELEIAKVARTPGFLKLAAVSQSTGAPAAKLLLFSPDEGSAGGGHSKVMEHVMLFGDIANNMMFDGWMAIGVCVLMMAFGWTVAVRKFNYLNSIQQGSEAFLKQWAQVASDLTTLDHNDEESVRSMGGNVDKKTLKNMHRSPLFHLYHIGSEEIRLRLGNERDRAMGLSSRSIQAIRASLESGLVLENQRMNKGLIFLTISIAGGPYVGLLGTVVGVMVTFAIIAKNHEVDVNSIAPGIASALLATVAGLVVAIPALFIYSYLNARIKDLLAGMQVFIDEFIAKMAEFYPTPGDIAAAQGIRVPVVSHSRSAEVEAATNSSSNNQHAG